MLFQCLVIVYSLHFLVGMAYNPFRHVRTMDMSLTLLNSLNRPANCTCVQLCRAISFVKKRGSYTCL